MQSNQLNKAFILVFILVIGFVVFWEFYWRNKGFTIAFNDDKVNWADKRKQVYLPPGQATIFIGSSRIKFDLDIPTWESQTGEKAVQLAFVGTSARPVLHNLAADTNFGGNVIIDVTEHAFFSVDSIRREKSAREGIEYFNKETPSQKAGAKINYFLESKLVFLEEGKFGLNALLLDLRIPNRPGVFAIPVFPKAFAMAAFERQASLTPIFLADEKLQKIQSNIWIKIGEMTKSVPISGPELEAYLKEIKTYINRIRARGGSVVFVRPPSTNEYLEREMLDYPREKYWDKLIEYTGTTGVYFSDYPETANLRCPENSHLSPEDAVIYTKQLIKILRADKYQTTKR
jgi:hypothetical protein